MGIEPVMRPTIAELRQDVATCKACPLWRGATQAVFGEGPAHADVILVGEQPGDREDVEGHPFVGPAGRLLDRALLDAGIDRASVYVTNTVKHFKYVRKGKRRIHQKPNREEIGACRQWLDGEIAALRPRAIVALGATATQTLLGPKVKVTTIRGQIVRDSPLAPIVTATVHPSSVLRAPDEEARHDAYSAFVQDLRTIARALYGARKAS
ncbi:MAG: UdgX family uracil-DNA binding protein [Actinomycetota bacterium]